MESNRTRALYAALLAGLALLAGCAESERPGTPPKHVLLVTVDTLRADHLSAYLYDRPTSYIPASEQERLRGADLSIDTLAKEGVLFRNAFAPRGMTSPSVASLMTGLTPLEHGLLNNGQVLDVEHGTLAESFQAAGFDTAGFTSNALLVEASGLSQGFDTFACYTEGDKDLEVVKGAMAWLNARDLEAGPPTFLWLHFMGPHLPYDPLPMPSADGTLDFASRFSDPDYEGTADGSREFLDRVYRDSEPLSGLDVNEVVSKYDGEIARINYILRTFLQLYGGAYEDPPQRRLDDTVFVFASDHGEELYERYGYWAHSKSVYSSVLHVPLFIRHPGSLTGRRVLDEHVTLEDVMPTLLEWFDLAPPRDLYGRSLLPLVDSYDEFPFESRPAFGMWRDQVFTLRVPKSELESSADGHGDWRLIVNPEEVVPDDKPEGPYFLPKLALYDLHSDPKERVDVGPGHPEVVEELRALLTDWLGERQRFGRTAVSEELLERMDSIGYGTVGE
ncbi:MAG: sulfatase [Planctomycetota bacterium]|nr:sulfatase [Planctomycetota bacterium]